jgi:hypothetical protein
MFIIRSKSVFVKWRLEVIREKNPNPNDQNNAPVLTVESPQAFKNRPKDAPLFVICYLEFGISPVGGFPSDRGRERKSEIRISKSETNPNDRNSNDQNNAPVLAVESPQAF